MATTLIQHRRGTEAEWSAANPILAAGELGYSTDASKIKVGNGASQWSALPYSTTDISTLATRVSLGSAVSISATKTSLGVAMTALQDLADTRATQVSLGNVQSQLTDVIGNAPAALDTIHELADALADNADILDLYATQVSLGNTDAQLESQGVAFGVALNTKADTDDPTFTTGITTPKVEIHPPDGTIQGKDIVGNDSLRLRTINNADLTIEPHGTGTVEVTKDVKVTGKVTASGLEMTSSSTIQGKDIVGNNTLKLRTIGNSDLSIEPAGTGIVQISTDVNLATGKEFKVNGVAIGGSSGFTASSTDTLTNKSGSNSQWTNDEGFTTTASHTGLYALTGHVHTEYADAPLFESKTGDFNAGSGRTYFVDTSGGAVTATLPATPTQGDEARFIDVTGDFATNNLTVAPGSEKIQGAAADMINSTARAAFALVYYNAAQGWLLKDK